MKKDTLNIIFAGFGGQGVLFAGKVAAYAGLIENREVSWLPSYGPEMRGGTANCSVCLSDEPIGSPLISTPDVLVALNQPSFDKFKDSVVDGGTIIVDSTMVKDYKVKEGVEVFAIPAAQIAEDAEFKGLANVVCVGQLYARTHFCSEESLQEALKRCVPARKQHMVESNTQALALGIAAEG